MFKKKQKKQEFKVDIDTLSQLLAKQDIFNAGKRTSKKIPGKEYEEVGKVYDNLVNYYYVQLSKNNTEVIQIKKVED